MEEQWKPAHGFEGWYEVSDGGRARRVTTQSGRPSGRLLKPLKQRGGYFGYSFTVDNAKTYLRAHRLVWEAFNGAIPEGMQVNHLNGAKADNRLVNLEICTPSENTLHAIHVLRRTWTKPPHKPGSLNGRAKLNERDLPEIRRLRVEGWSQQRIADRFGVHQTIISGVLRGAYWRGAF